MMVAWRVIGVIVDSDPEKSWSSTDFEKPGELAKMALRVFAFLVVVYVMFILFWSVCGHSVFK